MIPAATEASWMRHALRLARRGTGRTSPNPMVGAVLVRDDRLVGAGWHRAAGGAHAEVEAIRDAKQRGNDPSGATLFVTLEPCCTHGRTPPCTRAILDAGIRRVVVAVKDPNPRHAGRGLKALLAAGVEVAQGLLEAEAAELNEAFFHWIVRRVPWVTLKAAMTLDGKIATASGESKWITGAPARRHAMRLRYASDAILVGSETVLADDPSLTIRGIRGIRDGSGTKEKVLRRFVLDGRARTPLEAKVISTDPANPTTIVVTEKASGRRVEALARKARVWTAPADRAGRCDLAWVLEKLGQEQVLGLLVEGGGEVHASFCERRLANRVAFFYAPLILGGRNARKPIGGAGAASRAEIATLGKPRWRRIGDDLFMTAPILA